MKDYVATRWYRAPELCGSFFSKVSYSCILKILYCIMHFFCFVLHFTEIANGICIIIDDFILTCGLEKPHILALLIQPIVLVYAKKVTLSRLAAMCSDKELCGF